MQTGEIGMEPNCQIISEILITLRINNTYPVSTCNFPHYDCEELTTCLKFLTEIGLVNTSVTNCGEGRISHRLTCDGEKVTEKLMDGFYENLM